jgi:hypothetical protein
MDKKNFKEAADILDRLISKANANSVFVSDGNGNVDIIEMVADKKKELLNDKESTIAEEVEDIDITDFLDNDVISGLNDNDISKMSDVIRGALDRLAKARASKKLMSKKVKRVPPINDAAQVAAAIGLPGLAKELTVEHPKPIITDVEKVGNAVYSTRKKLEKQKEIEESHKQDIIFKDESALTLAHRIGEIEMSIMRSEIEYEKSICRKRKMLSDLKDKLKEILSEPPPSGLSLKAALDDHFSERSY